MCPSGSFSCLPTPLHLWLRKCVHSARNLGRMSRTVRLAQTGAVFPACLFWMRLSSISSQRAKDTTDKVHRLWSWTIQPTCINVCECRQVGSDKTPPCSQHLPAGSSSFLCRVRTRQCNSRSASSPFNNWWQPMRRWRVGVSLPLHHLSPLSMKTI